MSRKILKISVFAIFFLWFFNLAWQPSLAAENTFWKYQCIDTVKYSRDAARAWAGKDSELDLLIASQISSIKNAGANCVALATPYDAEFIPFLSKWVLAARAAGLTVWFRGNLSGWEGWFNYPKFSDVTQHNSGIYSFITQNPLLFADGDLFTPAPEPENGILGNPFSTTQAGQALRNFMASSYANCQNAFAAINKNVQCGFFSNNGDVAKDILNKPTVENTGNLVTVDHYVKIADQLGSDLQNLHNEFGTNVFLGEFGAPIPDIHGNLTEDQQAELIDQMLNKLYQENNFVIGVNYWTLAGGSTSLLNDDGTPRKVYQTLQDYYIPGTIEGTVSDDLGDKLSGVTISDGTHSAVTDADGNFNLMVPANHIVTLSARSPDYQLPNTPISVGQGMITRQAVTVTPLHPSLFYKFRAFYLKSLNILFGVS